MRRLLSLLPLALLGPGCERDITAEPTAVTVADSPPRFGLVIHGGAGTIDPRALSAADELEYRNTLTRALDAGYAVLDRGGPSLDAVESAILILENSPLFNAGKGAVFTHDGRNELDASIMDGASGKAGAIAGVQRVKNPIRAARAVMEASPHVLLSGPGADAFAADQGLELVEPNYFRTQMRWDQLQRALTKGTVELDHGGTDKFGTVGAVAVDQHGHLAAATSTGGMTNKRWGRIGDSPVIGAGTYARDASCAVSATGHGEFFIREAAAHSVCARMEYGGATLGDAARAVVFEQLEPIGGTGGVIALDARGSMAAPFNTPGMYRGHRFSDGSTGVFIWDDEHPREQAAHTPTSMQRP
ncbi:MAG: isoaspartyl peptidase/L-asparaginase family protein [Nannocystales bacterium]